jgi:hypothetical protein
MDRDPFDLQQLRIDPERVVEPANPKKWRRQFVRVLWAWVERLQKAKRVSTYRSPWCAGGRPFALSNVFAHAEGLSRRAGTAGQSRLFNDYSITITCPSASTSPGSARKEPREHITTTASPLLLAPPEDEGHHRHLIYLKAAFLKRAH